MFGVHANKQQTSQSNLSNANARKPCSNFRIVVVHPLVWSPMHKLSSNLHSESLSFSGGSLGLLVDLWIKTQLGQKNWFCEKHVVLPQVQGTSGISLTKAVISRYPNPSYLQAHLSLGASELIGDVLVGLLLTH